MNKLVYLACSCLMFLCFLIDGTHAKSPGGMRKPKPSPSPVVSKKR